MKLPETLPSNLRSEVAERYLTDALDAVRSNAGSLFHKLLGPKSPLCVAGQRMDVPDLTQRDAYTFTEGLRRFVTLATGGQEVLPRRVAEALFNIEKDRVVFTILYRLAFLVPQEWIGLIGEVREEVEPEETDVLNVFRSVFTGQAQPDVYRGSGGVSYEFNAKAAAPIAAAIHRLLGDTVDYSVRDPQEIAEKLLERCPKLEQLRKEGQPLQTLTAIVDFVLFEPS